MLDRRLYTSLAYSCHILVYNGIDQIHSCSEPVMILHLFPLIFWAILTTLAITPLAIKAAIHFQLIDQPNSSPHKIHQRPVPKAGGLAIALVIISISFLSGNLQSDAIRGILLASIIIFLFGLWDDTHRLSARWKFAGQFFCRNSSYFTGCADSYARQSGHFEHGAHRDLDHRNNQCIQPGG